MDKQQLRIIKNDFQEIFDDLNILAVILFGSQVDKDVNPSSDIDVCVVVGRDDFDKEDLLSQLWKKVGGQYDLWIFEELQINIQSSILEKYEIILCDDPPTLGEYLYPFYKKVATYRHRLKVAYGRL